jgi:hypothetical protein
LGFDRYDPYTIFERCLAISGSRKYLQRELLNH